MPRSRLERFLSTPSARRATYTAEWMESLKVFLSTPSARRATWAHHRRCAQPERFLSTPSARRATGWRMWSERWGTYFYPRPPRGGRHAGDLRRLPGRRFLSTPSARRATLSPFFSGGNFQISIHALREEGDWKWRKTMGKHKNFYPRPPRGGRHPEEYARRVRDRISIHALREEGDSKNRDKISIFKQIIQHSARI